MKFPYIRVLLGFFAISYGCVVLQAEKSDSGYAPVNGDILFQSFGGSPLVDMIEGATASEYSHCGIAFERDGDWFVIEAIGPVREIPLNLWLKNGERDGFAAYRLNPEYTASIEKIIDEAQTYLGRPYDIRYRLDDEYIYCSELIYKAFLSATGEKLGDLSTLSQLDWKPYEDLILKIENGAGIPLDREIITPVAVARAKQLKFVYSKGIEVDSASISDEARNQQ